MMCSFFVLVVFYINLGPVRLYHIIHLPNWGLQYLLPGFCLCVSSKYPTGSENVLIQMNGTFSDGLYQCFPNFFMSRTITLPGGPFLVSFVQQIVIFSQILHVLDPKKFPRTNLRVLADHKWSANRSLGNTGLYSNQLPKNFSLF